MIKQILRRLSLKWVLFLLILLTSSGAFAALYMYSQQISRYLATTHQLDVDLLMVMRKDFLRYVLIAAGVAAAALYLLYGHVLFYLQRISSTLNFAVAKKKLALTFEGFSTHDVFEDITKHANALTAMFRNFDQMKSARITLEVNSMKQLMNTLSEGVLFLNRDRVVTHINHRAEEFLRLVPGEIVGESVHRFVSNPRLLKLLDDALEMDKKITKESVNVSDTLSVEVAIIPVKNKQGILRRVMIVLTQPRDSQEKKDEI